MRSYLLLMVAAGSAVAAASALAQDSMMMVKKGETIAVMPDGHMGTMMTMDKAMMMTSKKMAKPLRHCMMFMMGEDGKMYMIDAKSGEEKKACEKMAM
jgi:hypothetical protein